MNDNHEILPSPQGDKPPINGPEHMAGAQGDHSPEAENMASRAMENPAFSPPPMPDPSDDKTPQTTGVSQDMTDDHTIPHTGHGSGAQQTVHDDTLPQIADDVDLIEKEWVSKTKEIVQETRDDPFRQNKKIVHLRADYMKKRYNKDIKIVKD